MPDNIIYPSTFASEPSVELTQQVTQVSQRFFSLFQASQAFGKSPRTLRWWADTGRIRTIKIGRARFVTEAEIQRLIAGHQV